MVENKDSIYTQLTRKYKVTDYFYPVDRYKKANKIHILSIHILSGDEKEIAFFANALKKNKNTIKLEKDENILIIEISEEEKFYEMLYNPELYMTHPVLVENGIEHWHFWHFIS